MISDRLNVGTRPMCAIQQVVYPHLADMVNRTRISIKSGEIGRGLLGPWHPDVTSFLSHERSLHLLKPIPD